MTVILERLCVPLPCLRLYHKLNDACKPFSNEQ